MIYLAKKISMCLKRWEVKRNGKHDRRMGREIKSAKGEWNGHEGDQKEDEGEMIH